MSTVAAVPPESSITYRIHANTQIRTTISNWGYFGNRDGLFVDSASGAPDEPAPAFESPPRSGIEYLYEAGLMVGGIVGSDTLVSVGTRGFPDFHELYPDALTPPLYSDDLGDEEFTVVYYDTLTNPKVIRRDTVDGPHRPLHLRIRQTTRLVGDRRFGQGLIIDVAVTNIGTALINDVWVGWFVDPDIGQIDRPRYWEDDYTGHRTSAVTFKTMGRTFPISAAWAADNDGDPVVVGGRLAVSVPAVFASMYLGGEPTLTQESYNWWSVGFPGRFADYDWGPQRIPGDSNVFGGNGMLLGDAMKYRAMSNREIDYDQVFAAVDQSADGWTPPPPSDIAKDLADGTDTRFLHSVGSVDLAPGDSVVTVWVWAAIPRWHTDPLHFAAAFDYDDPETYRRGLGLARMDTLLARMMLLWQDDYRHAAIGPPHDFAVADWTDSTVLLRWTPRQTRRLFSYWIGRSTTPEDQYSFDWVGATYGHEFEFVDRHLRPTTTYFYRIHSVKVPFPWEGPGSAVDSVVIARPKTPVALTAQRGNASISLAWVEPDDRPVAGYRVYRNDADSTWQPVGESDINTFTDYSAQNAVVYHYRVTSLSARGIESYPSDSVMGIAFAFDGPPLILDQTLSGPSSLTDKDSVRAVWERLLAPVGAVYRDADPATTPALELGEFDGHPATVVVSDGRFALRPETAELVSLYTYAGGIVILCGRDLINHEPITEGTIAFDSTDFPNALFGITAAYYPRVLLANPTRMNAEFVGAHSVDPAFSDLTVDSSRTGWGLNPALPPPGPAVPFVGYFEVDTSRAEVVYTFVSKDGNASPLHGQPVGVIAKNTGRNIAAFSFPFSYISEADARTTVLTTLGRLGWSQSLLGDVNGDGLVNQADPACLIDELFRRNATAIPKSADVNDDGSVDVRDAVVLAATVTKM